MSGIYSSFNRDFDDLATSEYPYSLTYNTELLPSGSSVDFEMNTGKVAILLILSVNNPCTVEIHSTPDRNDPNPYRFQATSGNLTDIGRIVFDDGTDTFRDRYAMIANGERPVLSKTYWSIKNDSGIATSISLAVEYALVLK